MNILKNLLAYGYGLVLCILIALGGIFLSTYIPLGAVAIAIILGIIIGNLVPLHGVFKKGIALSEKKFLSLAIALMGVKLDFAILKELGTKSIFLVIIAMIVTILSAVLLAKIFKIDRRFGLLLGIGNGVCGSSAIAATARIIGAEEKEVGLSVAVVNFLGTIGIFLIPFIGKFLLHLTNIHAGILAGNTLQAVGQVVAAGFSMGDDAGQTATIIKMSRVLMLFPLVFVLIFFFRNKDTQEQGDEIKKVKKPAVPLFIIGFALFSLIPTFKLLPEEYISLIGKISHYLLVTAMAGIGLKITIQSILRDGKSALLIGALIFCVQILFSTAMITLFFK